MDEILASCALTGAVSSELLRTNAVKLDLINFTIIKHLEVVATQSTPRATLAYIFTPIWAKASIARAVSQAISQLERRVATPAQHSWRQGNMAEEGHDPLNSIQVHRGRRYPGSGRDVRSS